MVIGLTGGICTGKSTVEGMLREMGAHVIDADELAHRAIEQGTPAHAAILKSFGSSITDEDGGIDRKRLGAIVFKSVSKRRKLEEIVHPEVFRQFEEERDRAQLADAGVLVVFSAALLIETGYHAGIDRMVVVYAPEPEQLRRLLLRDGLSPEDALARIKAQLPIEAKKELADHVIDNSGSIDNTRRQVEALLLDLEQAAQGV